MAIWRVCERASCNGSMAREGRCVLCGRVPGRGQGADDSARPVGSPAVAPTAAREPRPTADIRGPAAPAPDQTVRLAEGGLWGALAWAVAVAAWPWRRPAVDALAWPCSPPAPRALSSFSWACLTRDCATSASPSRRSASARRSSAAASACLMAMRTRCMSALRESSRRNRKRSASQLRQGGAGPLRNGLRSFEAAVGLHRRTGDRIRPGQQPVKLSLSLPHCGGPGPGAPPSRDALAAVGPWTARPVLGLNRPAARGALVGLGQGHLLEPTALSPVLQLALTSMVVPGA